MPCSYAANILILYEIHDIFKRPQMVFGARAHTDIIRYSCARATVSNPVYNLVIEIIEDTIIDV